QAEDGIRDFHVTGVQTCALPIFRFCKVSELTFTSYKYMYVLRFCFCIYLSAVQAQTINKEEIALIGYMTLVIILLATMVIVFFEIGRASCWDRVLVGEFSQLFTQ